MVNYRRRRVRRHGRGIFSPVIKAVTTGIRFAASGGAKAAAMAARTAVKIAPRAAAAAVKYAPKAFNAAKTALPKAVAIGKQLAPVAGKASDLYNYINDKRGVPQEKDTTKPKKENVVKPPPPSTISTVTPDSRAIAEAIMKRLDDQKKIKLEEKIKKRKQEEEEEKKKAIFSVKKTESQAPIIDLKPTQPVINSPAAIPAGYVIAGSGLGMKTNNAPIFKKSGHNVMVSTINKKGGAARFKGAGIHCARVVRDQISRKHGVQVGSGLWSRIKGFFRGNNGKRIAEKAMELAKTHGMPLAESLAKQGVDKINHWATTGPSNTKKKIIGGITNKVIVPGLNKAHDLVNRAPPLPPPRKRKETTRKETTL